MGMEADCRGARCSATDARIWVAEVGSEAALGDHAARAVMRARGFIDSKSCAVSADRSATRYARR